MYKLSISNIAWPDEMDESIASLLQGTMVSGIETTPNKVIPWEEPYSHDKVTAYKDWWQEKGFEIPAMQALLYGAPESHLFISENSRKKLYENLCRAIQIAQSLGATRLVFGSPKNRTKGAIPMTKAMAIATDFFKRIGAYAASHGVKICIESNPAYYSCDFITTTQEAANLVCEVNHPGFGLHLDTGGMHLSGDNFTDISKSLDLSEIQHFHISEKDLNLISGEPIDHKGASDILTSLNYSNWVSIEMLAKENHASKIMEAIAHVEKCYF